MPLVFFVVKKNVCIFAKNKYTAMKSVVLNVPDSGHLAAFDFGVYMASKMYEDGILSAGQASSVAGLSKRAFIEIMGKYGVSVFSSSLSDLKMDIANA